MFSSCKTITSLDLSSFNTSKVTEMNEMFRNCSALQKIYVGDGWMTEDGSRRVARGGGCNYQAGGCRVSVRYYYEPWETNYNIGLRLAL